MKAVEVEETAIEAAIPSGKAVTGAKVTVSPPGRCPEDCGVWGACHPEGVDGEKLLVEEVLGPAASKCPLGIDLQMARLR